MYKETRILHECLEFHFEIKVMIRIKSESQQKWRISIFEGFTNREILY